jgi:predicted  nucleic acid-binding Zn-ribbon protein
MSDIESLIKLQLLKNEETNIKKELKELNKILVNIKFQHDELIKEKDNIIKTYTNSQNSSLDETLNLEAIEEDVKRYEKDLFSSGNNPKLLNELEEKIKVLNMNKDKLEDTILTLIDDLEAQKILKESIEEKCKIIEQKQREIEMEYLNKEKDSIIMFEEIDKRINELKEFVNQESLSAFDKAFLKGQGIATSLILNNCCNICKSEIPLSIVERIKKDPDTLHFCENCGRILYLK